ncbi:MAG TPA: hypothetical protein DIW81_11935 [Planctomycetaceae bacterium]|uniref:hypothetical protein n=2 Tax=Rubinisphaera TaxID=1649490 RepID=UPI000C0FCD00|nr:hypothetical protein [Rubinisphaera sp.]MBV09391.1 hypothetical protein [Rubinisphaera sp.]HCS52282.1 hypothetical protein [Planctomycetaceae bacterium]|tara:strand:- start:4745 stop:5419 length:675 start_codon:yes stop_codon:yes gene_type:complete
MPDQHMQVQVTIKNQTMNQVSAFVSTGGSFQKFGDLPALKEITMSFQTGTTFQFKKASGQLISTAQVTATTRRIDIGKADPTANIPKQLPRSVAISFLAELNRERALLGLPDAILHDTSSQEMVNHSTYMANQGQISHDNYETRYLDINKKVTSEGYVLAQGGGEVCAFIFGSDALVVANTIKSFKGSSQHWNTLTTPGKILLSFGAVKKLDRTYVSAMIVPVQ